MAHPEAGVVRDPEPAQVPLIVDVDALLGPEQTIEAVFALIRAKPTTIGQLPVWLARGPPGVRSGLARAAPAGTLGQSLRADVLAYLRAQRTAGRPVALVGGEVATAECLAQELRLFDIVWAGDAFAALSPEQRRERLERQFRAADFDYLAGRGRDALWRAARGAWVVAPSERRLREIAAASSVRQVFAAPAGAAAEYLRALRPHHWIKNLLLLVAVATGHRWPDLRTQAVLLWGLVAFCLCASSNYLLNDLFDLTSDRRHPEIRHRPLASGLIRPSRAVLLLTVLLVAALAIAARLSPAFLGILVAYYLLITLYSLRLKEVAVLDVFILAGGYALRVAAGAYVVGIRPSMWLIALCAFLFLSLALIKRYAELIAIGSTAGPTARVRGYLASDASLIASQGVASGYLAVLVLALYTNTSVAQHFYGRHELFWAIALLLLYWINYLWLMARRGRIAHDPVVFALQNRTSQWLVIAMAVVTACAL